VEQAGDMGELGLVGVGAGAGTWGAGWGPRVSCCAVHDTWSVACHLLQPPCNSHLAPSCPLVPPLPPPPPNIISCRYADGPRYYSDPKLFSIQLDPYVPPTTYDPATADEETQVQLHAAALLHQLSQLYVGMALSALLGRVFVLPPLQCYCWNSGVSGRPQYNCRAAGDYVSALPFTCTLDQVGGCVDEQGGRERQPWGDGAGGSGGSVVWERGRWAGGGAGSFGGRAALCMPGRCHVCSMCQVWGVACVHMGCQKPTTSSAYPLFFNDKRLLHRLPAFFLRPLPTPSPPPLPSSLLPTHHSHHTAAAP
jgi:hypothetical protein